MFVRIHKKPTAILGGLLLAGLLQPVQASTTDVLSLSGSVPAQLNVTVTATGNAAGLDLTATQSNLKVADVTEDSNNPAGYTVTVTSTNLQNSNCGAATTTPCFYTTAGSGDALSFDFKKGNTTQTFTSNVTTYTDSNSTASSVASETKISYTGNASLTPGNYTETLTYVITAK